MLIPSLFCLSSQYTSIHSFYICGDMSVSEIFCQILTFTKNRKTESYFTSRCTTSKKYQHWCYCHLLYVHVATNFVRNLMYIKYPGKNFMPLLYFFCHNFFFLFNLFNNGLSFSKTCLHFLTTVHYT